MFFTHHPFLTPVDPCAQFRNMWAEFEWENKVAINTSITDVNGFLEHIVSTTNMRCLTPISSHDGERGTPTEWEMYYKCIMFGGKRDGTR